MSGIEVAGLVFGVLPLLIEAVKAYSSISDGFHTFRHYSREIKSSSVQLKVHNGIFLNECRLLLRLVEDEKGVKDMLEDEVDRRWTSKQFNDRLNAALRDNFELCRSIIEETKDIIEGLRKELNQFDVLLDEKKQVRAPPQYLGIALAQKRSSPSSSGFDSTFTGRIHQVSHQTPARCYQDLL